jgi:hypothetical protein
MRHRSPQEGRPWGAWPHRELARALPEATVYIWEQMPAHDLATREAQTIARAETMLAVADATGIDVDALAFVAARFEQHLNVLDAAEPARRAELERLVAEDFDELAAVYKRLRRAVERGGEA